MKGIVLDMDGGQTVSKPPKFAECYVCQRQFGSHSLSLHEPRCLQRWQAQNQALPPNKRSPTPVKLDTNGHRVPPLATLTASWPSSNGKMLAAIATPSPRPSRPRTTTLSKPKVLDAEQAQDLDMTTTRVSDLLAVTSLSSKSGDESSASNYSLSSVNSSSTSSSNSPSSSSLASSSSSEDMDKSGASNRVRRPGTLKIGSGPREMNVPNIDQRARTAVISSPEHRARPGFMPAEHEARMPSPCVSCGKHDNPERLHSHPEDPPGTLPPAPRARRLTKKRLSIQRPVPMKYKRQPPVDSRQPAGQPYQEPEELRRHQNPAERRRQEKRQEAREQQARLKQEEGQRRLREQAMQQNLDRTLSKYERPAQGPTFIVCYMCGRQFGPTSLPIHQPQCLEVGSTGNSGSDLFIYFNFSAHFPFIG